MLMRTTVRAYQLEYDWNVITNDFETDRIVQQKIQKQLKQKLSHMNNYGLIWL